MNRVVAIFTLLILFTCLSAHAQVLDPHPQLRAELEALGFQIEDEAYQAAIQSYTEYIQEIDSLGLMDDFYLSKEFFAHTLLINLGMGSYAEETWAWTPSSDQIFAFDAEVFSVETMYTDFMNGVQAIVDDADFTEISEDYSGLDENLEGIRSVSFNCNNRPYTLNMQSMGDWINLNGILPFVNRVLAEQGCSGQLDVISDPFDQIILIVYGSSERTATLRTLIGTSEFGYIEQDDDFLIEIEFEGAEEYGSLVEEIKMLFRSFF